MEPTSEPPLRLEPAAAAAELEAALELRRRVFVDEQGIPIELERDESDDRSIHLVAWCGRRAVATARLTPGGDGTGIVSRVAVDAGYRGQGLGAGVMLALERLALERACERLVLHPHAELEPFYERLGYRTVAGTSWAGPHRLITMEKRLEE